MDVDLLGLDRGTPAEFAVAASRGVDRFLIVDPLRLFDRLKTGRGHHDQPDEGPKRFGSVRPGTAILSNFAASA